MWDIALNYTLYKRMIYNKVIKRILCSDGVWKMARTANVFTRVDPTIKAQAEAVLNQLGISMATAMEIYLRFAKKNFIWNETS